MMVKLTSGYFFVIFTTQLVLLSSSIVLFLATVTSDPQLFTNYSVS
jgi:hypothetical protein